MKAVAMKNTVKARRAPVARVQAKRAVRVQAEKKDRWAGLADDSGPGNDQMDIHRGRGMVGGAFQGAAGMQGTHNQIQSSSDYMSGGLKTYDNTTAEGYYISKPFFGQAHRARRQELHGAA